MSTTVDFPDKHLDGLNAYVENEDGKPWWDTITAEVVGDKDKNMKVSKHLHNRTRYLSNELFDFFSLLKKYEKLYNMDMNAVSIDKKYRHMSCNLLRIGVNAIHSMIGREMPEIKFMTNRAHYNLRKNVGMLNDYIAAEFEHSGLYKAVRAAIRDAACLNIGIVKIKLDDQNLKFGAERIRPFNLLVDDKNEMYDMKDEVFERRLVSKYVLLNMFPDLDAWQVEKIKKAADSTGYVACYEGFYTNHIHVIFIEDCILFAEPWYDVPPYFYWRWTAKTNSFYGKGICEEGLIPQNRLNEIYYNCDMSMKFYARNKVIITGSGRFSNTNISNQMDVMKFHGSDVSAKNIQFVTPSVLHPQYFQLIPMIQQDFFLSTSLSQLTATGQKEKGVYTASGAMAVHDIQQSRFAETSQSLVDMYVDVARFMARSAGRAYLGSVEEPNNIATKIDWIGMDLQRNYQHIVEGPQSLLSKNPAQRQMQLMQQQQAGWITPQQAQEKFDTKDYKANMDLFTSSVRNIEFKMNKILEGEEQQPDSFIPADLQYEIATKFFVNQVTDGLDEDSEIAGMFRNYIATCSSKINTAINAERMAMIQAQMQAQSGTPAQPQAAQAQQRQEAQ